MNSDGGRCHDNARCESMWARMKSELLYDRYDTEKMTVTELKELRATGITVESVPQMMAFHPWSRDNNTIHLYRKQLRVVNP